MPSLEDMKMMIELYSEDLLVVTDDEDEKNILHQEEFRKDVLKMEKTNS